MSAQQPIDNTNIQSTPDAVAPTEDVTVSQTPDTTTVTDTTTVPTSDVAPATDVTSDTAASPQEEAQMIEGVAQALDADQLSARDIVVNLLQSSFGNQGVPLSANAANALADLLAADMFDDMQQAQQPEVVDINNDQGVQ